MPVWLPLYTLKAATLVESRVASVSRRARFAVTHHGMVFVPLGYSTPKLFDMDAPHGGSPYGAGTLAGPDGSRQPSALEKDIAEAHGEHFGTIAAKLAK